MPEDRLNWTFNGDPSQLGADAGVRAITTNDINMVFQPIVDIATGQLFAHEALVRCKLPQYASPPMLFLAAEKERACGHLGRVIRQQTFERCQDTALFVNVHPEELSQRWLVRPDDPIFFHEREVYLEITESAAFTHYDLCMSVLKDVCARAGVHLVVDDYGAGHSNLARILDLNPKIVKLDGALIRGIDKDARRQMMVRHMVALCIDLGAKVVAECIETTDELQAVADQGVHFAQGYVLARPAFPPPDFTFPLAHQALSAGFRGRPQPKPIAKLGAQDAKSGDAPHTPVAATHARTLHAAPQNAIPRPAPNTIPRPAPKAPKLPSKAPDRMPSKAPGGMPSKVPGRMPSKAPAKLPSKAPAKRPTPPALPAQPKRPPPLPGAR